MSVSTAGVQGNAQSIGFTISFDGRFIAFNSDASNLVAGDTNGARDIFVRDLTAGTTERVSVSTSGAQANGNCDTPAMSVDERFVAFWSEASNLVAGDTNGLADIFVRDRASGTTERVSVATGGAEGNDAAYFSPAISANGRFVAFTTLASNFVAGDATGTYDVFVRDRQAGTTECISVSAGGTPGDAMSLVYSISASGRFVGFGSRASNLVAGDSNATDDVFVRDRTSATTELVSIATGGAQGNSGSYGSSLSADGRFAAFYSYASNLVAGDTNARADAFVRDRVGGTTERVSLGPSGVQGNGRSGAAAISADGRFVVFDSDATNFLIGDANLTTDVFVRDRSNGTTECVSVDPTGATGNFESYPSSISDDGRFIAFHSRASNLVAGDSNGTIDVFVRDRGLLAPKAYCSSSTSSHGCIANIVANANPSVALGSACAINITNVEGMRSGIVFYGINNAGFTPGPWAAGSTSSLCVKHPTQRTPIQNSGGTANACNGSFVLDWKVFQATHPLALGNPWSVNAKVYVQAWFRDPLAVKATNLSNALELTYIP